MRPAARMGPPEIAPAEERRAPAEPWPTDWTAVFPEAAREGPTWLDARIGAWDDARWRAVEPFVVAKAWTDRGSVNVFRVIGTQHPDYQGLTWREFLQRGKRMGRNLALYQVNPAYYVSPARKDPSMYYLTLDGGLSYYLGEDGNHRTAIARCAAWARGDCHVHGVTVTNYRIDWELARVFRRLADLLIQLKHRYRRARLLELTVQTERAGREDGPGWMLERHAVRLAVTDAGGPGCLLTAEDAIALERRWAQALQAGSLWRRLRPWTPYPQPERRS